MAKSGVVLAGKELLECDLERLTPSQFQAAFSETVRMNAGKAKNLANRAHEKARRANAKVKVLSALTN